MIGIFVSYLGFLLFYPSKPVPFTDNFDVLHEDSLQNRGWILRNSDSTYWSQRNQREGFLSLYTLTGDQWISPSEERPMVLNSLWRKIESDCFDLTLYFSDFIPSQNWQQAGLFLAEDTSYTCNALRVTFGYSGPDSFYTTKMRIPSLNVGTVIFNTKDTLDSGILKPIAFKPYRITKGEHWTHEMLSKVFKFSALRITRNKKMFQIYESHGHNSSVPFRLVHSLELDLNVNYVELFAHRSFREIPPEFRPVHIDKFVLKYCE